MAALKIGSRSITVDDTGLAVEDLRSDRQIFTALTGDERRAIADALDPERAGRVTPDPDAPAIRRRPSDEKPAVYAVRLHPSRSDLWGGTNGCWHTDAEVADWTPVTPTAEPIDRDALAELIRECGTDEDGMTWGETADAVIAHLGHPVAPAPTAEPRVEAESAAPVEPNEVTDTGAWWDVGPVDVHVEVGNRRPITVGGSMFPMTVKAAAELRDALSAAIAYAENAQR